MDSIMVKIMNCTETKNELNGTDLREALSWQGIPTNIAIFDIVQQAHPVCFEHLGRTFFDRFFKKRTNVGRRRSVESLSNIS